jgi:hypothetical protein
MLEEKIKNMESQYSKDKNTLLEVINKNVMNSQHLYGNHLNTEMFNNQFQTEDIKNARKMLIGNLINEIKDEITYKLCK